METLVLIPVELSLAVTRSEGVQVWSSVHVDKGTRFYPFQGTVRLGKIPVEVCVAEDDVKLQFGCYEVVQEVDDRRIRKCNWIRFLSTSHGTESVNLTASLLDGQPVFDVVRSIPPHSALVVQFQQSPPMSVPCHGYNQSIGFLLQEGPLDLSRSLLIHKTAASVPTSLVEASTGGGGSRRQHQRTLLPCEVCGKAFDRPSLLKRHMRTHTGEKPHVCEVCAKGFSTSSSLNTHRRIHSGEKPHQCQVCGKRFTASSNLYYHRMTHNKEKPHKCALCHKSFPTPGDLKSHMYVHSGSWPYRCSVCSRGFSKQTNLRNHLFLHTGDKPHTCQLCNKRFALACNLRAHMKTHEEDNLSTCLGCHKTGSSLNSGYCHLCIQFQLHKPEYAGISGTSSVDISEMTKQLDNCSWLYNCPSFGIKSLLYNTNSAEMLNYSNPMDLIHMNLRFARAALWKFSFPFTAEIHKLLEAQILGKGFDADLICPSTSADAANLPSHIKTESTPEGFIR